MRQSSDIRLKIRVMQSRTIILVLMALMGIVSRAPLNACTIFVLTDEENTLFFNNEDWSNPKTRIWFKPGVNGRYGAAYVGFNDGWAQGGMNTEGLAFDWVAGFKDKWKMIQGQKKTIGNPTQRMIETCATVEQAIAFFRKYYEPSFSYARVLIADKHGNSAIVGARNYELLVLESNESRGFGFGRNVLRKKVSPESKATVENGRMILEECFQSGKYATKYSNVFDLKTGSIHLYHFPNDIGGIILRLGEELSKGGHYYDMPRIREQLDQPVKPLLRNMMR